MRPLYLLAVLLVAAGGCSRRSGSDAPPGADSRPALGGTRPVVSFPVPEFEFTSQDGEPVGRKSLLGKVWVASFVFVRCAGPCPDMTVALAKVQEATRDLPDLHMVTFTVDPERDTLEDLKRYGEKYGADFARWSFLRGPSREVGPLQTEGFKIGDHSQPANHSTRFILVDKEGNIRRYYEGREDDERAALIADIRILCGRPGGGS